MAQEKFGVDRYLPAGEWVPTTDTVGVAGLQKQRSNVQEFVKSVKAAEKKRLEYGLELELEPDNRADPNAIKVIGFAETAGWFGKSSFTEWHIGYIDQKLAKKLHGDILAKDIEIVAELDSIQLKNGKLDIKVTVLAGTETEEVPTTH